MCGACFAPALHSQISRGQPAPGLSIHAFTGKPFSRVYSCWKSRILHWPKGDVISLQAHSQDEATAAWHALGLTAAQCAVLMSRRLHTGAPDVRLQLREALSSLGQKELQAQGVWTAEHLLQHLEPHQLDGCVKDIWAGLKDCTPTVRRLRYK